MKYFSVFNTDTGQFEVMKVDDIEGKGGLPEVTAEDNGKILKVAEGQWGVGEENSQVPINSDSDGLYAEV